MKKQIIKDFLEGKFLYLEWELQILKINGKPVYKDERREEQLFNLLKKFIKSLPDWIIVNNIGIEMIAKKEGREEYDYKELDIKPNTSKEEIITKFDELRKSKEILELKFYYIYCDIKGCNLKDVLNIHLYINKPRNKTNKIPTINIDLAKEMIMFDNYKLSPKQIIELDKFINDFMKKGEHKIKKKINYLRIYRNVKEFKKLLIYHKEKILRNIIWTIYFLKIDNENVQFDTRFKDLFKVFQHIIKLLPKWIKINRIYINTKKSIVIRSKNSNEEFLKEAIKALEGKKLPPEYYIYCNIDGCDIYEVLTIYMVPSSLSGSEQDALEVYFTLGTERGDFITNQEIKLKHILKVERLVKNIVKKSGKALLDYIDFEIYNYCKDKLDYCKDHYRKSLSKRALKLFKQGKLNNFRWKLLIKEIDGKKIDLSRWRLNDVKKKDYGLIKKAVELVADNLPKEAKISKAKVVIENTKRLLPRKELEKEVKTKKELLSFVSKALNSIELPEKLDEIEIYSDFKGMKDVLINEIYVAGSYFIVWPIGWDIVVNTKDRKDVKLKHIYEINRWVKELVRKKEIELNYITYWEK